MSKPDLNILVVDDNEQMRNLLKTLLRTMGMRNVQEASDGAEAMHILGMHDVDLIITDLAMAPVDGVDFVRLLRNSADSPKPTCPVIMVSGNFTERRINEARDAGVNEFLSKPVTAHGVMSRIEMVIDNPRPFVRSASYFGPDRRRRADAAYKGPRRRKDDAPQAQPVG